MRKDEELRQEILQDIERLPDKEYFHRSDSQRMLLDILFIFCKLNPDIGYRQGMHELLAPIAWVVFRDAIDIGEASKTLGQDALIKTMFDADHIEHDSFTLFGQIMQSCKSFYVSDGPSSMASRSRHIFEELLSQVDIQLQHHLENLDVVPQVYLIRWVRLLFGREFDFDSFLALWDALFAEDASLEIVDHICLAMLLRVRWKLVDADYNAALGILLKYPEHSTESSAQTLAYDAIYLQTHLSKEGGNVLVQKYAGRPILTLDRPGTPPALQRNTTAFSGAALRRRSEHKSGSPSPRGPRQARNIEAVLQNTAKNIYAQSEKLGIGKAVRNAVDEVHKKAQEIRDGQTSSPSPTRRGNTARSGSFLINDKFRELEARNKHLSELLAGAVNELWDCQRFMTESDVLGKSELREDNIEKLSAAIAKVQLVQVHLEEPSLILAEEEGSSIDVARNDDSQQDLPVREPAMLAETAKADEGNKMLTDETPATATSGAQDNAASPKVADLPDPSTFEDLDIPSSSSPPKAKYSIKSPAEALLHAVSSPSKPDATTQIHGLGVNTGLSASPARPSLAQSQFSFMLGQSEDQPKNQKPSPAKTSAHSERKGSPSLFGSAKPSRDTAGRVGDVKHSGDADKQDHQLDDDNEFDMNSLRRARRRPV